MTDVTQAELLPCPNPWCGGHIYCQQYRPPLWRVVCACGVQGPTAYSEKESADLWNTRPASTEPVDALAEAREAMEPVLHWYQSDEYPARPIAELVADIVADLQTDRRQALTLPRLIKAADRLSVCAQTTGGTAGRDEELVAAIDEYSKAAELTRAALSRLNAQGEVK